MPDLLEPRLTFAFEARVEVAPSIRIGRGPSEEVWFTPITGGVVTGNLTFQLIPVPEPATWAMMLVGFAGIGFAMRRRRQPVLAQVA